MADVRRSGRATKKPESIYKDAKRDEVESGEGGGEEEEVCSSEEIESSPEEGIKRGGASKKASTASKKKQAAPANRRSSAGSKSSSTSGMEEDDDEEDEAEEEGSGASKKGKGGGGQKRKRAGPETARRGGRGGGVRGRGASAAAAKKSSACEGKVEESEEESSSEDDDLDALVGRGGSRKKRGGAAGRGRGGGRGGGDHKGRKPNQKEGKESSTINDMNENERSLLYECVLRDVPVEKRMADWIAQYDKDEGERTSRPDMFNFLIWSSGGTKNYADPKEELPQIDAQEFSDMVDTIVEDLREAGDKKYPILEGAKGSKSKFKGFRKRFEQAWDDLIKGSRQGNSYNLEAVRIVIDLLRALCECSLPSIRHTAAFAGLKIGEALVKQTVLLAKKTDTANRQLEAEQNKAGSRTRKAIDLNKSIEEHTSNIAALEDVLEDIFNAIFATRYRDVKENIRADCMAGLGTFLQNHPNMFLKDAFVKYLGWTLYDRVGSVRSGAAQVLLDLYDKDENLPKLENFTARFLKRLQDLIHDIDPQVKRQAISILRKLQAAGYLDEASQEVLDEIDEMLLDPTWDYEIRKESMLFFTDHVDGFHDDAEGDEEEDEEKEEEQEEAEEEEGGAAAGGKKKGRQSAAAKKRKSGGGRRSSTTQSGSKRQGVVNRLVTVVQFLEYHLDDLPLEDCDQIIDTCVDSFQEHPDGEFLYDWPSYFDLLRENKRASSRLSDHEQSLLICLLGASVKKAASMIDKTCSGQKGAKGSKAVKGKDKKIDYEAVFESFTSGAVEELPKILSQFQTDLSKMSGLVILPQFLQQASIDNKRNKGHFETLLKLLKGIYLKSTEPKVLQDVASSLAHLLRHDENRLHNVEAIVQAITGDLLKRLSTSSSGGASSAASSSKRSSGRVAGSLSASHDDDFSAGLVLLQLVTLESKMNLKDYVDDVEAVWKQIQAVVIDRMDENKWSSDEERLQWTVRVINEGMKLLYVFLAWAELDFIRVVKEQKPKGKDEDEEEEEEAAAESGDEDEGVAVDELKAVLALRQILLDVFSTALCMGIEDSPSVDEESQSGGSARGSKKQKRQAVIDAMEEIKKAAYKLVSDCRYLFRPNFGKYKVLHKIVWSPDPDFLRLLQMYFQKEERRFEERRIEEDDSNDEADAALVDDLLQPLIRSVLYTVEQLNRRQAAAIASHFVQSGKQSEETVKYLMKQLKDMDMRLYLEVQMSTLRHCHKSEMNNKAEGGEVTLTKYIELAKRMAQTLGVGHPKGQESMFRFMKSGISYAFDDAPKNFTFLDGLHPYLGKTEATKVKELSQFFREKASEFPEAVKEVIEAERDADQADESISQEVAAYLNFQQVLGHTSSGLYIQGGSPAKSKSAGKKTPSSSAAKKKKRKSAGERGRGRGRRRGRKSRTHRSPGDDEEDPISEDDDDEEGDEVEEEGEQSVVSKPLRRRSGGRGMRPAASDAESEADEDESPGQPPAKAKAAAARGRRGRASITSTSRNRRSAISLPSVNEGDEDVEDFASNDEGGGGAALRASQLSASQRSSFGGSHPIKRHRPVEEDHLEDDSDRDSVFGELLPKRKPGASADEGKEGGGAKRRKS